MQLDFFDVPSPCVGVCQSDEKGHCLGCMRSRDERQNWQDFDNDKKQKVIKLCVKRKNRKENKVKTQVIETQPIDNSSEQPLDSSQTELQPSLLDPPSKVNTNSRSDLDFGDFEL